MSCPLCNKCFDGRNSRVYSRHVGAVHEVIVEVCQDNGIDLTPFIHKKKRRNASGTAEIKCKDCDQSFASKDNLNLHTCHSILDKRFSVDEATKRQCAPRQKPTDDDEVDEDYDHDNEVFPDSADVSKIMNSSDEIKCKICEEVFPSRQILSLHTCDSLMEKQMFLDETKERRVRSRKATSELDAEDVPLKRTKMADKVKFLEDSDNSPSSDDSGAESNKSPIHASNMTGDDDIEAQMEKLHNDEKAGQEKEAVPLIKPLASSTKPLRQQANSTSSSESEADSEAETESDEGTPKTKTCKTCKKVFALDKFFDSSHLGMDSPCAQDYYSNYK